MVRKEGLGGWGEAGEQVEKKGRKKGRHDQPSLALRDRAKGGY